MAIGQTIPTIQSIIKFNPEDCWLNLLHPRQISFCAAPVEQPERSQPSQSSEKIALRVWVCSWRRLALKLKRVL